MYYYAFKFENLETDIGIENWHNAKDWLDTFTENNKNTECITCSKDSNSVVLMIKISDKIRSALLIERINIMLDIGFKFTYARGEGGIGFEDFDIDLNVEYDYINNFISKFEVMKRLDSLL